MPPATTGASHLPVRDLRTGVVWSAGFQPSGVEPDSYAVDLQRGPRRDHAPRRHADDDIGSDRLGRGRRRSSPGFDHEFGKPPARHRDHVLRRTRPRAPERRRRASGLLEAVRGRPNIFADVGAILATRRKRSRRRPRNLGGASERSSMAKPSASRNSRPTGRDSSAADTASARRSRCMDAGR